MPDQVRLLGSPTTLRGYARLAGVLYFVTHVTSVLAVVAYGDDPLGVRAGVLLEFVLALGCLGTGVLLWPVLRHAAPVRAASFAALRALEAAVILAGVMPMLAIAWGGVAERWLVDLHTASFLLGQGLVISVNTIVLGSALVAAGLVPRALGVLGLAGGSIVLASNLAQLFDVIPLNGAVAGLCAIPVFAFEIWFAVTLVTGYRLRVETP